MEDIQLPLIAKLKSYKIEVEKGKKYYWCSCGKSKKQPFCDGSHAGTSFAPTIYEATENKIVGFCGCKHSNNPPLCDGSHRDFVPEN